jgi:hypothetical protein
MSIGRCGAVKSKIEKSAAVLAFRGTGYVRVFARIAGFASAGGFADSTF